MTQFMDKVKMNIDSGCWDWSASKDKDGYGHLAVNGKFFQAHRYSYETVNRRYLMRRQA